MKKPTVLAALLASIFAVGAISFAQNAPVPAEAPLGETFRLGQKLTINGRTLFVEKIGDKLLLSPPLAPTQSIGAFITPVDANSSSTQPPMTAQKTIDGSDWGELFPGSNVWVHGSGEAYQNGGTMWTSGGGDHKGWISFDLGRQYNVSGAYVWNYNQGGGWNTRSIKRAKIESSDDGQTWVEVGEYDLELGPGADGYTGQTVPFGKIVKTRYFRFNSLNNYRDGEQTGLAEVRFANADIQTSVAPSFKAKYPCPQFPKLALGQPLAGSENITFPDNTNGIVNVTRAPYGAKGDGITDDTDAIQRALNDNPNKGAVIYLPNGVYLVSKQLRWGGGDDMSAGGAAKFTIMQGQSRLGTVLKLKDAAPLFDNPTKARGVIWTGHAPAQRFGNEIRNLTVDTGTDNRGAAGIQFIANNQGGVFDVSIQSGDGQGTSGLDMAYTDEEGPLLVKRVSVKGFDVGVATANAVASITMEDVSVEDQNKVGWSNGGQPISVRSFKSNNEVPAIINGAGLMTLIDSTLTGRGAAKDLTAMVNSGEVFVRNLKTSGYKVALDDKTGGKTFPASVAEHSSREARTFLAGAKKSLGLPIEETPDVPRDDSKTWATPEQFGGKTFDGQDDSPALQKAIDSGATTIYLCAGDWQFNSTIIIRGKVRRITGEGWLVPGGDITGKGDPLFRFADGEAPVVLIERLATDFSRGTFPFMENDSKRTLVMKDLCINFHTSVMNSTCYRNTDRAIGGKVFIEDVVGSTFRFKGQSVWARQLNAEGHGFKVINDGGKLWILGLKTESLGGVLMTTNGGRSEVLGGLSQTNGGHLEPMFANHGGEVSVYFAEQNNSDDPYRQLVVEERGTEKQSWDTPDANFKGLRVVFYEGRLSK